MEIQNPEAQPHSKKKVLILTVIVVALLGLGTYFLSSTEALQGSFIGKSFKFAKPQTASIKPTSGRSKTAPIGLIKPISIKPILDKSTADPLSTSEKVSFGLVSDKQILYIYKPGTKPKDKNTTEFKITYPLNPDGQVYHEYQVCSQSGQCSSETIGYEFIGNAGQFKKDSRNLYDAVYEIGVQHNKMAKVKVLIEDKATGQKLYSNVLNLQVYDKTLAEGQEAAAKQAKSDAETQSVVDAEAQAEADKQAAITASGSLFDPESMTVTLDTDNSVIGNVLVYDNNSVKTPGNIVFNFKAPLIREELKQYAEAKYFKNAVLQYCSVGVDDASDVGCETVNEQSFWVFNDTQDYLLSKSFVLYSSDWVALRNTNSDKSIFRIKIQDPTGKWLSYPTYEVQLLDNATVGSEAVATAGSIFDPESLTQYLTTDNQVNGNVINYNPSYMSNMSFNLYLPIYREELIEYTEASYMVPATLKYCDEAENCVDIESKNWVVKKSNKQKSEQGHFVLLAPDILPLIKSNKDKSIIRVDIQDPTGKWLSYPSYKIGVPDSIACSTAIADAGTIFDPTSLTIKVDIKDANWNKYNFSPGETFYAAIFDYELPKYQPQLKTDCTENQYNQEIVLELCDSGSDCVDVKSVKRVIKKQQIGTNPTGSSVLTASEFNEIVNANPGKNIFKLRVKDPSGEWMYYDKTRWLVNTSQGTSIFDPSTLNYFKINTFNTTNSYEGSNIMIGDNHAMSRFGFSYKLPIYKESAKDYSETSYTQKVVLEQCLADGNCSKLVEHTKTVKKSSLVMIIEAITANNALVTPSVGSTIKLKIQDPTGKWLYYDQVYNLKFTY